MQVAQLGVGVLLRYINSTHTIRHLCNGCFKRLFSRPSCIWNELQLEGVVFPPIIVVPRLIALLWRKYVVIASTPPPPASPVWPFSFDVTLTLVLFDGYFRNHVAIDKKASFCTLWAGFEGSNMSCFHLLYSWHQSASGVGGPNLRVGSRAE